MDPNCAFHEEVADYVRKPSILYEASQPLRLVYSPSIKGRLEATKTTWHCLKRTLYGARPLNHSEAYFPTRPGAHHSPSPSLIPCHSDQPQIRKVHSIHSRSQSLSLPTDHLSPELPQLNLPAPSMHSPLGHPALAPFLPHQQHQKNLGTLGTRDERHIRSLVVVRILTALHLSINCPFPETRLKWSHYLGRLEQYKYLVPQPLTSSPSFFILPRYLVKLPQKPIQAQDFTHLLSPSGLYDPIFPSCVYESGDDKEEIECSEAAQEAAESLFCQDHRLNHLGRIFMYFPTLLTNTFININAQIRMNGHLPMAQRYYLAIMACAELNCYYGVSLFEREFLRHEGDPKWLAGLNYVPPKLQSLAYLNSLLAHRPWAVSRDHFQLLFVGLGTTENMERVTRQREAFLTLGPDAIPSPPPLVYRPRSHTMAQGWLASDLSHAVFLLTTCHAFAGLALSCGAVPEVDIPGGFALITEPAESSSDQSYRNSQATAELTEDPFFARINRQVEYHVFHSPTTRIFPIPTLSTPAYSLSAVPGMETAQLPANKAMTWKLLQTLRRHSQDDLRKFKYAKLSRSASPDLLEPNPRHEHYHRANLSMPEFTVSPVPEVIGSSISMPEISSLNSLPSHQALSLTPLSIVSFGDDEQSIPAAVVPHNPLASYDSLAHPSIITRVPEMADVHMSLGPKFAPLQRFERTMYRYVLGPDARVTPVMYPKPGLGLGSKPESAFRNDLTWDQHGSYLLGQYLSDQEEHLKLEFRLSVQQTDYTVGDPAEYIWATDSGIDTEPFRMAVWHFTQSLCGVQWSDYDHHRVPALLSEKLRRYITKIVYQPDSITSRDFNHDIGYQLRVDETCLINFLVCQAKRQATLMLALRKLVRPDYN
ncbi:hypothetical protein H4R33_003588 [Dimargaris cristalligena]|nr:hypothetical protein H4R33_003588 [Dimargaris cristalligena]